MKVRLQELDDAPSTFKFQADREELIKLDNRFVIDSLSCEAVLRKNREFVELKGHYRVHIETQCDLCLAPVTLDLDERFNLDLTSEESQQQLTGDVELSLDSLEIDYFTGEEIHLTRYFEDQLILDLPLNFRCTEECKGLCSECGGNLNEKECDCSLKTGNNPFLVLKDLDSDS